MLAQAPNLPPALQRIATTPVLASERPAGFPHVKITRLAANRHVHTLGAVRIDFSNSHASESESYALLKTHAAARRLAQRETSGVHPRFRTPYVSTVVVGVLAAALAGLIPLNVLGELVSMGTLLAFATVCIGVLVLRYTKPDITRPFKVPVPWLICPLGAIACVALFLQAFVVHWHLFVGWTVLGLLIYFGYGMRHSKLNDNA